MTARKRFTLDCKGQDGCTDPSAGRGRICRADMLLAMLAVPFDGQHVVKRFILPAPALL